MSLILNIDTSTEKAVISLAENGIELFSVSHANQKDHAGFLHYAIKEVIQKKSLSLSALDAIAVTGGPGSYTGLRVGMASAKGLCYALNKPFISVGTLNIMAHAVITETGKKYSLYCPLVDARRMEVFTALFDNRMNLVFAPAALVLNEHSFKDILETKNICFFGSGAPKLEGILTHTNAFYEPVTEFTGSFCKLSFELFSAKNFTHLVDSEPLYIKEFYSSPDNTIKNNFS